MHGKGAQHGARRAQHPQAGSSWRREGAAETPSRPGLCSTTATTLPAGQGEPGPRHEADTAWVQACTQLLRRAEGELLSPQTHEPHPAPGGTPNASSVPSSRLCPAQRVPQHLAPASPCSATGSLSRGRRRSQISGSSPGASIVPPGDRKRQNRERSGARGGKRFAEPPSGAARA